MAPGCPGMPVWETGLLSERGFFGGLSFSAQLAKQARAQTIFGDFFFDPAPFFTRQSDSRHYRALKMDVAIQLALQSSSCLLYPLN